MQKHVVTINKLRRQETLTGWLCILPITLGILIFQVYPVIFSLSISFTNWNLLKPPRWIALSNYIELFTNDRVFYKVLSNTALYACAIVICGLILALVFANLLNQKIKGQTIYRAIYFVPVVAPTAAIALLWQWIYQTDFGVLNELLKLIGIQGPPWLTNTHWAMWAVIIEAIWAGLGLNIVIFLAGLQGISKEYYEAASIDGANTWHRFWFITIPLLSPITFFVLVTSIINAFQVFDVPYVMTAGGPANATYMVVMYLYASAFNLQRMGLASALGYILFVIILILTFINFRLEKKWVFYEENK